MHLDGLMFVELLKFGAFLAGQGNSGQLGNGSKTDTVIPAMVPGLRFVMAVAGGAAHSAAGKRDV